MADLRRIDDVVWQIDAGARADMRVPARVFADGRLLEAIRGDDALTQLQNVATLPGIVEAAIAMPDVHQGYGFPVGTVAATELPDGVVSPGGVGYDINCGVRLLALPLTRRELGGRKEALVHEISRRVPAGAGRDGRAQLAPPDLDRVLVEGPRALVEHHGMGLAEDVEARSRGGASTAPTRPRSPSGRVNGGRRSWARWDPATTSSSSSSSGGCTTPTRGSSTTR